MLMKKLLRCLWIIANFVAVWLRAEHAFWQCPLYIGECHNRM